MVFSHQDEHQTAVVGKGGDFLSLVPSQVPPCLSLVNGFRPEAAFLLAFLTKLSADFFGQFGMKGSALATVI